MSESRHQAVIDAPVESVWEYVGDPARYPEWWPRVIEVRGERFEEGAEFVQVTRGPVGGEDETVFQIDRMDELREVRMHCTLSGAFAHWQLTAAQGGTFVDVAFGMEPSARRFRLFDMTLGRPYFRRWVRESVNGLAGVLNNR